MNMQAAKRVSHRVVPAWDMNQMHDLAGFADVWSFEKKYAEA